MKANKAPHSQFSMLSTLQRRSSVVQTLPIRTRARKEGAGQPARPRLSVGPSRESPVCENKWSPDPAFERLLGHDPGPDPALNSILDWRSSSAPAELPVANADAAPARQDPRKLTFSTAAKPHLDRAWRFRDVIMSCARQRNTPQERGHENASQPSVDGLLARTGPARVHEYQTSCTTQ